MARQALAALGTSIFPEMTRLAVERGAVNLSQGFPDFDGPPEIVDAAVTALKAGHNQYGRSMGLPALVEQIAAHQRRCWGIEVDPLTEVCAFAGATEGIAAAMIGLLEAGDEVVLFEPYYDGYPATVAMAGATARVVTLRAPAFRVEESALRAALSPRTRMIVVNSPHNPTGRVLSVEELDVIARVCVERDLVALTDEVYEHLVFAGARHVPLATRPGMRERTVALSSTGKTFSFTGWKVGWATGPAPLIAGVQRAHQFLTFCAATPLHAAMATALERFQQSFFTSLLAEYTARRDFLVDALRAAGFSPIVPEGTYFVLCDLCGLTDEDDVTFARRLIDEAGVAAIPPSVFYTHAKEEGRRLLRFAFCKREQTLDEAARRLRAWHASRPRERAT
ncbi:MAG: aminotransferase class I/II-fold pyridoxal phosphate-dependent enzyme [Deltaproteobacteria bacterium]|nr:aminotransferase class I/II-fold pyridoxal phosphate-dependent enzyme [Deltaproteobacteria bacterium]